MEIGISAVVKQYNLSAAFPGLIPNILSSIQRGATVIMLCRSEERASEACEWIKEASKDSDGVAGSIRYEQCNLGSVESVKKCAERLNESLDKVCLVSSGMNKITQPGANPRKRLEKVSPCSHFATPGSRCDSCNGCWRSDGRTDSYYRIRSR